MKIVMSSLCEDQQRFNRQQNKTKKKILWKCKFLLFTWL